jgi:hypothetical protein
LIEAILLGCFFIFVQNLAASYKNSPKSKKKSTKAKKSATKMQGIKNIFLSLPSLKKENVKTLVKSSNTEDIKCLQYRN